MGKDVDQDLRRARARRPAPRRGPRGGTRNRCPPHQRTETGRPAIKCSKAGIAEELVPGADQPCRAPRPASSSVAGLADGQRERLLDVDVGAPFQRRRSRPRSARAAACRRGRCRAAPREAGPPRRETPGTGRGAASSSAAAARDRARRPRRREPQPPTHGQVMAGHLSGPDEGDRRLIGSGTFGCGGPGCRSPASGRRRQDPASSAVRADSVGTAGPGGRIGIVYQKSGSSSAPHCRLNR